MSGGESNRKRRQKDQRRNETPTPVSCLSSCSAHLGLAPTAPCQNSQTSLAPTDNGTSFWPKLTQPPLITQFRSEAELLAKHEAEVQTTEFNRDRSLVLLSEKDFSCAVEPFFGATQEAETNTRQPSSKSAARATFKESDRRSNISFYSEPVPWPTAAGCDCSRWGRCGRHGSRRGHTQMELPARPTMLLRSHCTNLFLAG